MKKLTAFLLCLCLMIPPQPPPANIMPDDIPDWAEPSYQALEKRFSASIFGVDGNIDRGRFVRLLTLLLEDTYSQAELKAYPPV